MIILNNEAMSIFKVTIRDYRVWCRENHKRMGKKESKAEFFRKLQSGKLIRDENTGKLIKKEKQK